MIDFDFNKMKQLIHDGNSTRIYSFFKRNRNIIRKRLNNLLKRKTMTPYLLYLLSNSKGIRRINIYFDAFEKALQGDIDFFLKDQRQMGYTRALQGFHVNDVYMYTMTFKEALWQSIMSFDHEQQEEQEKLKYEDVFAIDMLLDGAYYMVSLSFFKYRDEIIDQQRGQLQKLQFYAAKVVSLFDEEKIWSNTIHGVFDIYGIYGTILLLDAQGKKPIVEKVIGLQVCHELLSTMEAEMLRSPRLFALDGKDCQIDFALDNQSDSFRFIFTPIQNRTSRLTAILIIHNQGAVFKFSSFERNLLKQFSYFTGAVSANCRMISDIAGKQDELHFLTGKLISVQEEERKKIAADIHDVITQSLTGVGYKTLYCMEIMDKSPEKLKEALNLLASNINNALLQSRQIIGNLHPRILDDLGLVPAIRKLTDDFSENFDLDIHFSHPPDLTINPDKRIAVFRILQEALYNVQRHSGATSVDVSIDVSADNRVCLKVADNGRGFDVSKRRLTNRNSGLGFWTMKERAEDLGGTFDISSRPDRGCSISVSVPLRSNANDNENQGTGS